MKDKEIKRIIWEPFVSAAILKLNVVTHFFPKSNIHLLCHAPRDWHCCDPPRMGAGNHRWKAHYQVSTPLDKRCKNNKKETEEHPAIFSTWQQKLQAAKKQSPYHLTTRLRFSTKRAKTTNNSNYLRASSL
jgi:hypothetical protein